MLFNGPTVWKPILDAIKPIYGDALIAGGAVRDWEHDQAIVPNDIDVFVPVADDLQFDMLFHELPFNDKRFLFPGGSPYAPADVNEFADNIRGGVAEISPTAECPRVQLIGKRPEAMDAYELIKDFDHSLCEFWTDGETAFRSQDARASMVTRSIIVCDHAVDKLNTKKRLRSLTRRSAYKGYSVKGVDIKQKAWYDEFQAQVKTLDVWAQRLRVPGARDFEVIPDNEMWNVPNARMVFRGINNAEFQVLR